MAERVKTRQYDSARPREQAAATRREILQAAQRLFEGHGNAATPMAPIAAGAGDAAPTDPDIGALWSRIQADFYDNQRAIVKTLDAKDALRSGLGVARATDIL